MHGPMYINSDTPACRSNRTGINTFDETRYVLIYGRVQGYVTNRDSILFVFGVTAPPVGKSFLIHEVSRSQTMKHHIR